MTDASNSLGGRNVAGLGERRAKALKIYGASDWWFYPLVLAAAVALVLVSLGAGAFGRSALPQAATRESSAYVFGATALAAGIETRDGHVLHVARDYGVSAKAVRIGVRPGMGVPSADRAGAKLLLTPADAAAFAGKPLRVEATIKRINVTNAVSLGVSVQDGGPITWATQVIPAADGVMTFDLPPSAAPKAIGFWVVSDKTDYTYGVEIGSVRVTPAG